jgi:formate dehydrogenase subunit delta
VTGADQGRLTSAEARPGAGPGHGAGHGTGDHLVKMANDIGNFFRSEPNRKDAVAGIANHIAKFWTRRMRQKLTEYLQTHPEALDELPREAMAALASPSHPAAPHAPEPPGGDAG